MPRSEGPSLVPSFSGAWHDAQEFAYSRAPSGVGAGAAMAISKVKKCASVSAGPVRGVERGAELALARAPVGDAPQERQEHRGAGA